MKIANKQDSFNQIKKLGLNRVPEIIATKNDRQKVEEFFNKYKAPVYVLRDVKHAMGKTYFIHDKNECFKHIDEYNDFFSLAVSIKSYPGRVLIGDIYISGDNVELTYSIDPEATARTLDQSIFSTIDDDRFWEVPGFSDLIKYITANNLFDVIVEFAVYKSGVGTKKEKVVIVELRTDY